MPHKASGYGWGVEWPRRQLIEIGNRVLCARVMGNGPTVVLEAGGAGEGTNEDFGGVLEARLAAFATVVTYDRAGSGRSDGPPHRSVAEMADDLDALIRSVGCATPVVIVGWSAGGLVAEMFAVRHPDKVAGLVLLDPSEMATESGNLETLMLPFNTVFLSVIALALLLGLPRTRVGRAVLRRMATNFDQDQLDWLYRYVDSHRWAGVQTARMIPRLGRYVRETKSALSSASLPDVPVRIVIPQPRPPGWKSVYARLDAAHRALAARFTRVELVPAYGTTHQWLPVERPDVIIAAVRDLLAPDG
jgi:pimeloyl-ACP methyl ester carboxylesterase